jgi:hypothetical protein
MHCDLDKINAMTKSDAKLGECKKGRVVLRRRKKRQECKLEK